MKLNPGVTAYVRRYRPAEGPNDSQQASTARLPYRAASSRPRRPRNHPATTPPIPNASATNPGKSTSRQVWRRPRIHACAYAEEAKYARQSAEKEPAASTDRLKPVARLSIIYTARMGRTGTIAVREATATAIQ